MIYYQNIIKKVVLFSACLTLGSKAYAQVQANISINTAITTAQTIKATNSITLSDGFSASGANGSVAFSIVSPASFICTPLNTTLSVDQNYISTYTPRIPLTDASNLSSNTACDVMQSIQYGDGLGRPLQTVQVKANPGGTADVIQPIAYDQFGREATKYLPYTTTSGTAGSYRPTALTDQNAFYQQTGQNYSTINFPSATTGFESCSLNRVLEQGAPGIPWQLSTSGAPGSGHTAKIEYAINKTTDAPVVILYRANPVATTGHTHERILANGGSYTDGELSVIIAKDENWESANGKAGTTWEYKDKQGRVVLKRNWETASVCLSTYYVYDLQGHLSFVLPPGALPDGGSIGVNDMDYFCYQYHYDGKGRLVEKKLPGKGWEWMVYGRRDELALSQDAVQRGANTWLFEKYDENGRVVITGELSSLSDRVAMQAAIDSYAGAAWEKYTGTGTYGYDNGSYPVSYNNVLTVNYYDRYDFTGNSFGGPVSPQRMDGLSFQTGSLVNVLGTGTMLLSVNYYDDKGRTIQQKSQNHLGGTDVVDMTYSFLGELLTSTRTHVANSATTTISESYTYDHMGRKLTAQQSINGAQPIVLSELVYNETGQVMEKKIANGDYNTAYIYNERGWLKGSNSPLFSEVLQYEDGTSPQYNGNIANQSWGTGSSYPNVFTYGYDKLNRLTSGVSTGVSMSEAISYDVMGNISSLTRDGSIANTYAYQGNQLSQVTGGLNTGSYAYDDNGNAKTDGRNGMGLTYNYLNLPQTASKTGVNLSYTYNASGNKLCKISNGNTTDYATGIQYNNGTIDFIVTSEGIARKNGGSYTYEYNLMDHLGNIRATIYKNPSTGNIETLQQDDYYPFGMRRPTLTGSNNNHYLYNGKELQDELGQYDYGARFYDAVIGRWTSVDPLAEKMRRYTPYNHAFNNPIRFVDADGMMPADWVREGDTYTWDANVHNDEDAERLHGAGASDATAGGNDHFYIGSNNREVQLFASGGWDYTNSEMQQSPQGGLQSTASWNAQWQASMKIADPLLHGMEIMGAIEAGFMVPGGSVGAFAGDAEAVQAGIQFTKSSLTLGRETHAAYMLAEEAMGIGVKEFREIAGIRPDFVNMTTRTIYELKPFNPASIERGIIQLLKYRKAFESAYPGAPWNIVLHTY